MTNNLVQLKNALASDSCKQKFAEMLGKKSAGFLTSVMTCVQNNDLLQKAEPNSIILAAGQAAALDLPVNSNLGLSAIIPFYDSKTGKTIAQFQIQKDGLVDLCLRSGQFEYIVNEKVYEGELVEKNRFTDTYVFDESKRTSNKVIGYMAAFKLTNGYKKTIYWTVEECKAHGMKYSQTFKKGFGLWKSDFDAMSLKSVLKNLLKKYAPKSIEVINQAIISDQASFVGDLDNPQAVYMDNDSKSHVEQATYEEIDDSKVDVTTGEVVEETKKEEKKTSKEKKEEDLEF